MERNWNERYLHQPPTDAPHPASFRKRDNHENKNVTFLCQINRGMKTKRVLLKFIYVILKLICKKFCYCQPDKDILTSSNYPQILKEARMDSIINCLFVYFVVLDLLRMKILEES